ncbi:hypothetical protein FQZ97_796020 [compost metagenome]
MAETVGLPAGDQLGVALDHLAEQRRIGLCLFPALREVFGEDEVAEHLQLLVLAGVIEVLEVAETHVAGRQAQQHRRAFLLLAPHRGARAGDAQRPAGGDAEGVQVFAGEEFADRRTQHRATVAHPRVGGLPGALEVQVPVLAGGVDHLAEQQPAAVAQARVVDAELVPGIDHRPRRGGRPQLVPGEQLGEHRFLGHRRVEVDQGHGRRAGDHQARLGDRLGRHLGGKGVAEAGEAVVEDEFGEAFQGRAPGYPCRQGRG